MNMRDLVKTHFGINVTQADIDEYLPEAQKKLSNIITREGDLGGERNKPYYLAALLGEIINIERFSKYCTDVYRQGTNKMKESTQRNVEMLPQTTIIVS